MTVPAREDARAATKERLIEAARDAFRRLPFDEVSIQEIVERARVSRGTFYNHFDDKETCFAEVIAHSASRLRRTMRRARRASDNAWVFLTEMFGCAVILDARETGVLDLIYHGPFMTPSPILTYLEGFVEDLQEDLEDGIRRGVLGPHHAEGVASALVGAMYVGATRSRGDWGRLEVLGAILVRTFYAEIAPKGQVYGEASC